jgi:flagellar basal-body rod modification protein FlgD
VSTTIDASSASSLATSATSAAVASSASDTSDLFRTLLVAQIRNQDPLEPMESKDFLQQFATMTQVESIENMSSMSSTSAALQASMLLVNLGSQVGSQVSVDTNSLQLKDTPVNASFILDKPVSGATATLTGSDGSSYSIALGSQAAGTVDFQIDPSALGMKAGTYTLSVATSDGTSPSTEVRGSLLGVRLDHGGNIVLDVDGVGETGIADISRFLGRESATTSQ